MRLTIAKIFSIVILIGLCFSPVWAASGQFADPVSALQEDRTGESVTIGVSSNEANVGDTLSYTITIPPNTTSADVNYSLQNTLPTGITYVVGTLETTGSDIPATYAAGIITWNGTKEKREGTYITTDNNDDGFGKFSDQCKLPFFDGSYIDIETKYALKPDPTISGDTIRFQFAEILTGVDFYGAPITGSPVFTDDGYFGMDEDTFTEWDLNNHAFPDTTVPNGIIAPWWRDMRVVYDEMTNRGVTAKDLGDAWLVEFDDIEDYTYPSVRMDYEIFAWKIAELTFGSPDIIFAYENVVGDWDWIGRHWGSVGMENYDASIGTTYAYNDWTPSSGDIVCFDFGQLGAEPVVITYDVIVDEPEDYSQSITNTVNYNINSVSQPSTSVSITFRPFELSDVFLVQTPSVDPLIPWADVPGNLHDNFTMPLDPKILGDPTRFYYLDAPSIISNRVLNPDNYAFYLDQVDLPAGFIDYWAAKGVDADATNEVLVLLYNIITGNSPMFYLQVSETGTRLVDGFKLDYEGVTDYLRVNRDYPLGTYRFTGSINDKNLTPLAVSVSITFIDAAINDQYKTNMNIDLIISSPGVMLNDALVLTDQVVIAEEPEYGTIELNTDGSFTYTPQPGYIGTDSFSYDLSSRPEHWASGMAVVYITVERQYFLPLIIR
jgi:uncharacterized repeat protein (TIGR01451 family)